jgi:cytochrome c
MGACESRPEPIGGFDPGPAPAALADGERTYNAYCRSCHGLLGTGTAAGPPLVHRIYEPSHHSDAAFQLAVSRGVRAHHWSFGNMPPLPTVDPAEAARATAYVRWLQRQAGIQ